MSYPIDTTIPAANNFPGDDQPKIQANFASINGYLSVDHVNPGDTNNGFHKKVTFNAPIADPATPLDNSAYLYTKLVNNIPQLFFLNKSGIQFSQSNPGSITILDGLIIKWGTVTSVPAGNGQDYTFPTAFPNNCLIVVACQQTTGNTGSIVGASQINNSTFHLVVSAGPVNVNYIAIGY